MFKKNGIYGSWYPIKFGGIPDVLWVVHVSKEVLLEDKSTKGV
jgi:hypothetical protein